MTQDRTQESRTEPWTSALRGGQLKPAMILFISPWLMVTWKYLAAPDFLLAHLPAAWLGSDRPASAAVYSFAAAFVLLGLIPALVVKLAFRERLADYGLQWGDRRRTAKWLATSLPFFVLGGYLSALNPAIHAYYPLNPSACTSAGAFVVHAASYFLFYLGWEFHFRGFLQYGLRRATGDANTVLIQTVASALLHIGRPVAETFCAILGGIFWGCLVFRTRSIVSGLAQHYCLGLSLDWFICRG